MGNIFHEIVTNDIQPNDLCLCAKIVHRIFNVTMSTAILFLFNNNNKYYVQAYQTFCLMGEVIHGRHTGLSETRMLSEFPVVTMQHSVTRCRLTFPWWLVGWCSCHDAIRAAKWPFPFTSAKLATSSGLWRCFLSLLRARASQASVDEITRVFI